MYDTIEKLECGTIIQHGKNSNRIYLMQKGNITTNELAEDLISRARLSGYSKIVAKVKSSDLSTYINNGYEVEGYIPKYYPGGNGLFYAVYYINQDRRAEINTDQLESVLIQARQKQNLEPVPSDINGTSRKCNENDIQEMVKIYKEVFPSYPFPIFEEEYIASTMKDNIDYFCVEINGQIAALASAELDRKAWSVEMTDFATLSEFRSKGYASRLLGIMESYSSQSGITTFYTIARACSFGMNITFSKSGYLFGGRLKNNTNISGQIESMNIWYKDSACTS